LVEAGRDVRSPPEPRDGCSSEERRTTTGPCACALLTLVIGGGCAVHHGAGPVVSPSPTVCVVDRGQVNDALAVHPAAAQIQARHSQEQRHLENEIRRVSRAAQAIQLPVAGPRILAALRQLEASRTILRPSVYLARRAALLGQMPSGASRALVARLQAELDALRVRARNLEARLAPLGFHSQTALLAALEPLAARAIGASARARRCAHVCTAVSGIEVRPWPHLPASVCRLDPAVDLTPEVLAQLRGARSPDR
jgi:hypothetical protein